MNSYLSLNSLQVTNQCVVICDLRNWSGPESETWQTVGGSQDDVGRSLAELLDSSAIRRIDDFGGVSKTFLCDCDEYLEAPPQINGSAAVFSFIPKKRLTAEGLEMARVSSAAGYAFLFLTVQKHDKFGKVWVLCGTLRYLTGGILTYYEDTASVVDELKGSVESNKVIIVHVQAPGYEDCVSQLADRVVSQGQYQNEVLAQHNAT